MPYMRDASGVRLDSIRFSSIAPPHARQIVADYTAAMRVGSANANMVRLTESDRLLLVVQNTGSEALSLGQGTSGSNNAPGSFPISLPVGQEFVSTDPLPVWAYFPTTAGIVRVYVIRQG